MQGVAVVLDRLRDRSGWPVGDYFACGEGCGVVFWVGHDQLVRDEGEWLRLRLENVSFVCLGAVCYRSDAETPEITPTV